MVSMDRTPRWSFVASRAYSSSSHRKPVGMRGMQSGSTVMEGAASDGQIAKKKERRRVREKDRESETVIRLEKAQVQIIKHASTTACIPK